MVCSCGGTDSGTSASPPSYPVFPLSLNVVNECCMNSLRPASCWMDSAVCPESYYYYKIVKFLKLGERYGNISKRLNIIRSTMQSIEKKCKESGTTDTLSGRGRKPKLTPRSTRKICRETIMNPRILLRDID